MTDTHRHHCKSTYSSDDLLCWWRAHEPGRTPVVVTVSLPTLQMIYKQDGHPSSSLQVYLLFRWFISSTGTRRHNCKSTYSSDHLFSSQNHLKSIWRVGSLCLRSVEIKIIWRVGNPEAQPLQRKASLLYTLWPNFNKKWFIWRVGRLKCRFHVCHTNQEFFRYNV
jgi:hypothetical protein